MIPRSLLAWQPRKACDTGAKVPGLGVSRVLGGRLKCQRWSGISGSAALDLPIHSAVKAGRIVTSGSLCLLPFLGCLTFCSPPVGQDKSAVGYSEIEASGQRWKQLQCAPGLDRTGIDVRVNGSNFLLQGGINCKFCMLTNTGRARTRTDSHLPRRCLFSEFNPAKLGDTIKVEKA